jgi:hypothetical protein
MGRGDSLPDRQTGGRLWCRYPGTVFDHDESRRKGVAFADGVTGISTADSMKIAQGAHSTDKRAPRNVEVSIVSNHGN